MRPRKNRLLLSVCQYIAILLGIYFFNTAKADTQDNSQNNSNTQISANRAAVEIKTGSGVLQKSIEEALDIENNHGINYGGMWIGDTNALLGGGIPNAETWTSNSLFVFDATADLEKLMHWNGAVIGAEFLQFNGQDTNGQAGSVQGYNSLPGSPPLDRSELYQLWYYQKLWNDALNVRVGKVVPSDDFGNVSKPLSVNNKALEIPAVSGLIYTPLFINPTTMGVIPGYYNSAYGVTVNITPTKNGYLSLGGYDGAQAQGVQTGIETWPSFDDGYFYIAETGTGWLLSNNAYPGNIGIGGWKQTGTITNESDLSEEGALGAYLFGTQRIWYQSPKIDISGVSMFYQYGISNSDVLPITQYVGAGLTAFGLVPHRKNDSFGVGTAYSWLNQAIFDRATELMFQGYYQAQITNTIYLEPALSFIPTPGASATLPATWTGTMRLIVLF